MNTCQPPTLELTQLIKLDRNKLNTINTNYMKFVPTSGTSARASCVDGRRCSRLPRLCGAAELYSHTRDRRCRSTWMMQSASVRRYSAAAAPLATFQMATFSPPRCWATPRPRCESSRRRRLHPSSPCFRAPPLVTTPSAVCTPKVRTEAVVCWMTPPCGCSMGYVHAVRGEQRAGAIVFMCRHACVVRAPLLRETTATRCRIATLVVSLWNHVYKCKHAYAHGAVHHRLPGPSW